jgi:hypothetical protein
MYGLGKAFLGERFADVGKMMVNVHHVVKSAKIVSLRAD